MSTPTPAAPQRRPWRRWAKRVGLGLIFTVVALVIAVWGVLSSLDAPWLKSRLQVEILKAAGLDVEWAVATLSLRSGLVLEDVRLRSPRVLQGSAPDFVRVARAEVAWSPGKLFRNERPLLDTVTIDGLAVVLVDDAQLGTTTGLLFPPGPPPKVPEPPGPGLSRTLADVFSAGPWVASLKVPGVVLEWQKFDQGKLVDHAALRGLDLSLSGWQARIANGAKPLELEAQGHHAALQLAIDADLSPTIATVKATSSVDQQDFEPSLHVTEMLQLEARARFEPKAHRLRVAVTSARLFDGAASASAELVRGDDGALQLDVASAQVDVPKAASFAAALKVPVVASKGSVSLEAHAVHVLPQLAFGPKGLLSAQLVLAGVEYDQATRVDHATVQAKLFAADDGSQHLGLSAQARGLAHGADGLKSLQLEGSAAQGKAGWHGQATVNLNELAAAGAKVASTQLQFHADTVELSPPRGHVKLSGAVKSLSYVSSSLQVAMDTLSLGAESTPTGHAPFAATVTLDGPLRLTEAKRTLFDGPLALELNAKQLEPEDQSGAVDGHLMLGDSAVQFDAKKRADTAHLEASVDLKTLGIIEHFVSLPTGWRVNWAKAGSTLKTTVDVDALSSPLPRFTHHTTAELMTFDATLPKGSVAVPSLQLALDGKGSTEVHVGTVSLLCARCAVGSATLGDEKLSASFDVDFQAPRIRAQLDAVGALGPDLHGLVTLGYVKPDDQTRLEAQLLVGRLGALAPLVAGTAASRVDLSKLGLNFNAKAQLPGRTLAFEHATGSVDGTVTNLSWEDSERSIEVSSLALVGRLSHSETGPLLTANLRSEKVKAELGEHTVSLVQLAAQVEATQVSGTQQASAKLGLSVGQVEQDYAPNYPVGGLKIAASASRDDHGRLTLARSTVVNEAAGTSLWVEGAYAPDPRHPKANAQAEVTQNVALAWNDAKKFKGQGTAVLKVGLHSADLQAFHTSGSLVLNEVDVTTPQASAEGIQGELPFAVDFTNDEKGVRIVRTAHVNPYALLRFQDQHPLLQSQSFLTLRKLTTPQATLAPIAANVQLSEGVLYVSQLEVGLSGGQITGEMLVDMNEKDSRVRANVRATGIKSDEGDVFSGNAALAISLRDHSIDGRAEVLQISRRQLLTLLDMQDPHHTSASTNRIRSVLALGYPERVHIQFNRGFASAKITFGGAAGLIQLDELRGIPLESLMDRYVFNTDDDGDGT